MQGPVIRALRIFIGMPGMTNIFENAVTNSPISLIMCNMILGNWEVVFFVSFKGISYLCSPIKRVEKLERWVSG